MAKYLIFIFFIFLSLGCSKIPEDVNITLELAGENGRELQAVIDNYQKPEDSLKQHTF